MARKDAQPGAKATAADRRVKALGLRKQGQGYRAIGAALGVSEAQAYRDVQATLRELAEREHASAVEYRTMEDLRLDAAAVAIWSKVERGDIDAVHAWVRISESRRRMRGLDAPTKVAPTNPDGTPYETQQQIIGLVLRVLAPYPDLRLTIAEQLSELEDAEVLDQPDDGA